MKPEELIKKDPDKFIDWLLSIPDEAISATYQKFLKDERFKKNKQSNRKTNDEGVSSET